MISYKDCRRRYTRNIAFPLSLTGKRWILASSDERRGLLGTFIAQKRNINIDKEVTWNNLCNPATLGDLPQAVERIHQAIEKKEHIGIIGDYDADGITGTAQLVRYFRRHASVDSAQADPLVILPHREKDGYGIKKKFIDTMHKKGVTLILTVDTGIGHAEEVTYAKKFDIDVIITDHHSPKDILPDALIVHPSAKQKHTNPHLCGSGVVFTLIRALENNDWEGKEEDCALAAVGTVADIVPLIGENRTIVQIGLKVMNKYCDSERVMPNLSPRVATPERGVPRGEEQTMTLAPIFQLAHSVIKKGDVIVSSHIGFRIAPRINAAGRLADPIIALNALLMGGKELERLQILNNERKEATIRMMEIADEMMDDQTSLCIVRSSAFHPGIIGLIAGKLTEKTGKPSIVCSEAGGVLTCSLRSVSGYRIADALHRNEEHLESCGGHAMAAGCTIKSDEWKKFTEHFVADANQHLALEDLVPTLRVEMELNESDLTLSSVQSLLALEPFGAENPEPRFLLQNQKLSSLRTVGGDGAHLQCQVGSAKAIGFRMGHLLESITDAVDIVCRLGIDTWGGNERVQIFIEDIGERQTILSCT